MFCNLVGSAALAASLVPEYWRDLVGAYLDAAPEAVTSYGGHALKKPRIGRWRYSAILARRKMTPSERRAGLAIPIH